MTVGSPGRRRLEIYSLGFKARSGLPYSCMPPPAGMTGSAEVYLSTFSPSFLLHHGQIDKDVAGCVSRAPPKPW